MNSFRTASPIVARTTETFVEHVAIGGESRRVEFAKQIIWLLEADTQILYRHGGKVVHDGSRYNDYYGMLTSIEGAAEDARKLAAHYSVDTSSTLEIVVVTKVMHTPAVETPETIAENAKNPSTYRQAYMYVPSSWRQERIEEGHTIWPALEAKVLVTEEVWLSSKTEQDNAAAIAAFVEKWTAGVKEA